MNGNNNGIEVYRNELKNREYVKEAPRFLSKLAGAEAAKLKKFSDRGPQRTLRSLGWWGAGGTKSGGCPTPTEIDASSCFGICRCDTIRLCFCANFHPRASRL
jgi:hypothetical protein